MNFENKKNKEELLERGFIEIGTFNGLECLAKAVDTGDEDAFAYHLLMDNQTVWDYPRNSNLREVTLLTAVYDKLFRSTKKEDKIKIMKEMEIKASAEKAEKYECLKGLKIQTKHVRYNTHSIQLNGKVIGELNKLSGYWQAETNYLSEFQGIRVEEHLKKDTVNEYVMQYLEKKESLKN